MFSSSIIKQADLMRLAVADVNYASLGESAGDGPVPPAAEEGFAPLTFAPHAGAIALPSAEEPARQEEPTGPQVTLAEGMEVIRREELQQQLDAHYRSGMQDGREQAERGLANVFRALRQGVSDLEGLRDKVLRESEDDLLKLAVSIARKIIQQEISQHPRILANIVAAVIADCSELERITIRLNPADYAIVAPDRQGFFGSLSPDTQVTLMPDENITPGGCIVDTTTGTLDAQIETQLDEIYRRLMEERNIVNAEEAGTEVSQDVDKG